MRRLTDEERDAAARVWWIARHAAARACDRCPDLNRYREEVESFAGEYLLGVVASYRPDAGAALETYVTERMKPLAVEWLRYRFRRDRYRAARAGEKTRCARRMDSSSERDCPVAAAIRCECPERVAKLFRRLNDAERRIAEPIAFGGLTPAEVGRLIKVGKSHVHQAWSRIVNRLGGTLQQEREGDEG